MYKLFIGYFWLSVILGVMVSICTNEAITGIITSLLLLAVGIAAPIVIACVIYMFHGLIISPNK
jgi:hypothetical protein